MTLAWAQRQEALLSDCAASRPAWERLSAAGRGLLSVTQPQA
jgi:hypothetical protein